MSIRFERSLRVILFLSFSIALSCPAWAARQNSALPPVGGRSAYPDAQSFAANLERIGKAIEQEKTNPAGLAALRKDLPSHWEVTAGQNHYSVSAQPLSGLLRDAEGGRDAKSIEVKAGAAEDWAFELSNQAKVYGEAETGTDPGARPTLEQILSRREFGSVRGPSAWELFQERVRQWIADVFLRLFSQLGRHPMGAQVLFWSVIVVVVMWLAVVLFRYWTRRAALEELQAPDAMAFVRTWQEWIQAAREAATRGDFREAVHSAYWAGIGYLEDAQVVRKDRTRTPREYMRLVSNATQLAASGRKTREALSSLTVVLEQVWYGRRAASQQDFANALQSVEALGCQLQ
jgi:hypothetical protein